MEREQLILDFLNKKGLISTQDLCDLVGVSISTIRRDLNSMHDKGLLIKTHGGAKLNPISNNSPVISDPYLTEKTAIAKAAASMIYPDEIIFLGSGVTCNILASKIKHINNLTVVTTSVDVINILAHSPVSLILLGGDIHVGKNHVETLGEYTLDILNNMFFDKAFFTVNGIDQEFGYSILNRKQIPLYQHLLTHSSNCYLIIDYSKFDHLAFSKLFNLDEVHSVITDNKIPQKYLDIYKEINTNVVIAP